MAPSWKLAVAVPREIRHDRLLALAAGAHVDPGLQFAVETVEVGRTLQERQRAHVREVAVESISRRIARDVDIDGGAALAAIGAEIGDDALENAARERRFKRGGREMRFAEIEFGGREANLRIDIVEAGKLDWIVAPGGRGGLWRGLRRGLRRGWRRCSPTSSRRKSRSSLTSGLLAKSTEAQPSKAPSPMAPDRPLIMTTVPLSRTSALLDSGARKRPGAWSDSSTGMVCRVTDGSGSDALMSKVSGWRPALRVGLKAEAAVGVDGGARADGFKAVFDVVARVEEGDRAVGDGDAPDFRRAGIVIRGGAGLEEVAFAAACRSRRSGIRISGWLITSSVISGWPDHRLLNVRSA